MKIKIVFNKTQNVIETDDDHIVQTDPGITIFDDASQQAGTFYPWHVIHHVRIVL